MPKIKRETLDKVKKIVAGKEHFKKDMVVIYDKNRKQFGVKIPKKVVDIKKIKKRDIFRFHLYPKGENKFGLEIEYIKK